MTDDAPIGAEAQLEIPTTQPVRHVESEQPVAPAPEKPSTPATPLSVNPPSSWRPPSAGPGTILAIAILIIVAVCSILYAWRLPPFSTAIEQTDNAYVRGKTTIISPQVSGYVVEVLAQDYRRVNLNDVLVRIDDKIYRARVAQARANLAVQLANLSNSDQAARSREASVRAQGAAVANAKAQLLRAQADMRRVDDLVKDGSVSVRERDQNQAALRQADAQLEQARAAHEIAKQDVRTVTVGRDALEAAVAGAKAAQTLAEIDLDHTIIRAPEAGCLSEIGVRIGQYVTAGTQLMFLVPSPRWVIANFKEAQIARMRTGQKANLWVDALGDAELTGRLENLAPAAGSEFAVLKADNATGNFVKIPQRIGVRIAIDSNQPYAERLRPGMSVVVRVNTHDNR